MKRVKIHKCIQYYNLDKQKWSKGVSLVENKVTTGYVVWSWVIQSVKGHYKKGNIIK